MWAHIPPWTPTLPGGTWARVVRGAGSLWETLVCRWVEDKGELHTSQAACHRRCYHLQAWLERRPKLRGTLFCLVQT